MARYLVTGAAGGMGMAICDALSRAGHRVFGLDRNKPGKSVSWQWIFSDVEDSSSLDEALSRIEESGGLDGVICCAGIYNLASLAEIREEDFQRIFNVNLFGVYRTVRRAVPLFEKNARVVILSSELAPLRPLPFTGIYAITKSALEQYAFSLRMELQLIGVRVSVVRPGAVKTDMLPSSLRALEQFCSETRLYPAPSRRFQKIVQRIEARSVTPDRVAKKVQSALRSKRPRLVYSLNRNPFLLLFSALPARLQLFLIRKLLSE